MKKKYTLLFLFAINIIAFAQLKLNYSIRQYLDGTTWQDGNKSEFTYNPNNTLAHEVYSFWDSNSNNWKNSSKELYSYNAAGFVTENISQEWNSTTNQWDNSYKETTTLNSNNLPTEFIFFEWDGSQWVNSDKSTISYSAPNRISQMQSYNWDGSQWVLSQRSVVTYGTNGKITEILSEEWDGSQWNNYSKNQYTYNANNTITESAYYDWENAQWVLRNKSSYQVDAALNRISETNYSNYDGDISNDKTDYTYDTTQLMSSFTHPFQQDAFQYILGLEDKPHTNKVLEELTSTYNTATSSWDISSKKTHYYDVTASTAGFEASKIAIYPNPTSHFITISNAENTSNYALFDLLGKTALKGNLTSENKINLQSLKAGVYFLQVQSENGNTSNHKIIKN